ncbi:MAG: hypothetical protein GWP39_02035 [Planctomycetia bacterium]|nr:hypothetical protein [Planctomycetia bacterium]NCG13929.1 hypothetical protein [Planctomycetia bacterium]
MSGFFRGLTVVLFLLVLFVFFVVGLGSSKENLRDVVIGMQNGFNEEDAGDVLAHCTPDFMESTYQLDQATFRGALFRIFLGQRDRVDKSFKWRVFVDTEEILLDPEPDENTKLPVRVTAPVQFFRAKDKTMTPVWVLEVSGEAIICEDGKWRFRRARFKTLSGKRPF